MFSRFREEVRGLDDPKNGIVFVGQKISGAPLTRFDGGHFANHIATAPNLILMAIYDDPHRTGENIEKLTSDLALARNYLAGIEFPQLTNLGDGSRNPVTADRILLA